MSVEVLSPKLMMTSVTAAAPDSHSRPQAPSSSARSGGRAMKDFPSSAPSNGGSSRRRNSEGSISRHHSYERSSTPLTPSQPHHNHPHHHHQQQYQPQQHHHHSRHSHLNNHHHHHHHHRRRHQSRSPPRLQSPSPHRSQHHKHQQPQDASHNFDTDHIIYDTGTDTTYLRGRMLGKGGFARCYELLCLADNKIYAGKIIHKSRISKPHQKQKILDEVDMQKDLQHRHVVQFHSYFEDDSNVYIILENCSRKSLVHMMKQHRPTLTEPEVRYFLRQMVSGVAYIHGRSIIHRDLKLGNLLIDETMDLKLADFGLATRIDYQGERKMTVCGTPNYIAPEVLQKKGHSYEADIWAMGCTMYAMLVGRPPFETSSLTETYQRITQNCYKIPSSMSAPAASLIRRCLSHKPQNRPTVAEILADEFFTSGFMPRSLPPSCISSVPHFPPSSGSSGSSGSGSSSSGSQTERVVGVENGVGGGGGGGEKHSDKHTVVGRAEPVWHLGNALSRLQLNSCSENLLEEQELEDIEKPAAQRSPKPVTAGQATKARTAAEVEEPLHSPQQIDASPKPSTRSAAALMEALSACLQRMPKESGEKQASAVTESSIVWVTKWVDYSNKYGFGFRLSTDTMGVLFNDTSRILLSAGGRAVQYCDMTDKTWDYTLDSVPEDLNRKTTLLQYFARYMDEHLIQGGELESSQGSDKQSWAPSLFLKKWFRTTKAILLYLTDGTLQVNFFEDHAKVIFSHVKGNELVTFIDPERNAKTYQMSHLARWGCPPDNGHRMVFAHTLLRNLVDIEGEDV